MHEHDYDSPSAPRSEADRHTRRDGESLFMLGAFMAVLWVPVMIGTAFADTSRAMIVNAVSGGVLLIFALAFLWHGYRTIKRSPPFSGPDTTPDETRPTRDYEGGRAAAFSEAPLADTEDRIVPIPPEDEDEPTRTY